MGTQRRTPRSAGSMRKSASFSFFDLISAAVSGFILLTPASARQPSAPAATAAPLRNLTWGQLNFLHSTDTHGWHAGHLLEPAYGGDWGDYISFATHMRQIADDRGVDLLVVDTGDRVEGNGLYDASSPPGKYTLDILPEQHIDLLCSGNHELYKNTSSWNELTKTVPRFKGAYLASNLDIWNNDTGAYEALAPRFKKFTTKNLGIRITAFGFLFDFEKNSNNTRVQEVEDTVREEWFREAIRDKDVDLFLVIGHAHVREKEFKAIFKAIRDATWDTPIQFFGGHFHSRDFVRFDKMSTALESGRYMETIGWLSIDGLNVKSSSQQQQSLAVTDGDSPAHDAAETEVQGESWLAKKLVFNRRYIDNNLYSYYHHTGLNTSTFPTEKGENVSALIDEARQALKLDQAFGCTPRTLWMDRVDVTHEASIYRWLSEEVIPGLDQREASEQEQSRPKYFFVNTGAVRFDLFEGPYTLDSQYIVSPFTNKFRILRDVKYDVAKRILNVLNQNSRIFEAEAEARAGARQTQLQMLTPEQRAQRSFLGPAISSGSVGKDSAVVGGHVVAGGSAAQIPLLRSSEEHTSNSISNSNLSSDSDSKDKDKIILSPGYVTHDDDGDSGDDTIHLPIPRAKIPPAIEARINFNFPKDGESEPGPDKVDVLYNEFIEDFILQALQFLDQKYTSADAQVYLQGTLMTEVISRWVQENWPCKD